VEIQGVEMLTVFDGLCYVGFKNPVGVVASTLFLNKRQGHG
jgi:hypothetical protein